MFRGGGLLYLLTQLYDRHEVHRLESFLRGILESGVEVMARKGVE